LTSILAFVLKCFITLFIVLIVLQLIQNIWFSKTTTQQQNLIHQIYQTQNIQQENGYSTMINMIPKMLTNKWEQKDIITLITPIIGNNTNQNLQNNITTTPLIIQGIISGNTQQDRILILKNSDGIHYDYYKKGDMLPTNEKIIAVHTKFVEVFQIVDNLKVRKKIPLELSVTP
jgi:alpha-N-acetylglucosamine transferase